MYFQNPEDMHEPGIVKKTFGNMAKVETTRTEACHTCGAKGACHSLGGVQTRVVTAINEAGAAEGDRVLLALPRKGVLGAGFLVYIAPIAALILGALLGRELSAGWGWDPQNGAVLVGVTALVGSFLILRMISKKLAGRKELTVRVVSITEPGEAEVCS